MSTKFSLGNTLSRHPKKFKRLCIIVSTIIELDVYFTQTANKYQKYFVPFNPFILEQIHITGAAAFPAAIIKLFF